MSEFKGTPGPWFVGDFGGVNGSGYFIGANPKPDGCTTISEVKLSLYKTDEQSKSNANLIAAAPELLEALQGLIYGYERRSGDGLFDMVVSGEDIERAVKTITKALGTDK